ncbi:MAG: hypothetical protein U0835_10410 [Isosphaeraceae bacterium]
MRGAADHRAQESKAVNSFVMLDGRHGMEIHLSKTRRVESRYGVSVPHVVTTSYLTHSAIERHPRTSNYGHDGPVHPREGSRSASG